MRFQTPKDKEIWERRRRESRGAGRDRPPPRSNPPTRDAIDAFRRSMAGDGGAGPKRASRSHSPSERPPAPSELPPVKAPLERATLKAPKEPEIILAGPADDGGRLRAFLRHGLIFAGLAIVIAVQGGLLIAALRDDGPKLDPGVASALRDGGTPPASDLDVARGGGAAGPLFAIDPAEPEIAPPTIEPEPAFAVTPQPDAAPLDRLAAATPKPDAASGGSGLQIAPELDIAQPEAGRGPDAARQGSGSGRPPELDLAASRAEPAAGPSISPADAPPARPLPPEAASGPRPDAAPTEPADAAPSALQPDVELNEVAGRALAQLLGEAGAVVGKAPSPQPAAGPIKLVTFVPDVMPTDDAASASETKSVAVADEQPPRSSGTLSDSAGLALAQLTGKAATAAMPRSGTGPREFGLALSTPSQRPAGGPMQAPLQVETDAESPERSFETAARSGVATTGSPIVNTGILKEAERIERQPTTGPGAATQIDAPQAARAAKERIEAPGRPQGRSAATSSQATADPAALSAARSRAPAAGSPISAQTSRAVPFQPDRSALQAATTELETPSSAAGLQVASEASSSGDRPALPADDIRVFIHHVADQGDAALAGRLADHLRRRGFTVADIRPVDYSIGEPSVRYFFAGDRAASRRLVDELVRFFEETPSRAPGQASDFTHFMPKPRAGNVEVWLPST